MSVAQDVQIDDFARPSIPNAFIKIQEPSHARRIDTDYKVIALMKRDRPDEWSDDYRRWERHHAEHHHTVRYITDRLTVWMQTRAAPGLTGSIFTTSNPWISFSAVRVSTRKSMPKTEISSFASR